jgi:TnpA family transposase
MPRDFLTDAERERFQAFPQRIHPQDLITYFTLSPTDLSQLPIQSAPSNRFGFAMSLCCLRYLGFCPEKLTTAPPTLLAHVAVQLDLSPDQLEPYGQRAQTRTEHLHRICDYLGFRLSNEELLEELRTWLLRRALEHDKPLLLLQMACERLYQEKIVRPGITRLERMVSQARVQATKETFSRLSSFLTRPRKELLEQLLVFEPSTGRTPLHWLRQRATTNSPKAILQSLDKLATLQEWGVEEWQLDSIHPNRLKLLTQIGRKSSNQALERMSEERRYPILLAFLRQSLFDLTDELIDMFDRCLLRTHSRSKRDLDEFKRSVSQKTNEKLRCFRTLAQVILDIEVPDLQVREAIYQTIPKENLDAFVLECEKLIRPESDTCFDYFVRRYGYIRQFSSQFIELLFKSNLQDDPLLKAIELLRQLNQNRRRKLPEDAPTKFVSRQWHPYVLENKNEPDRHGYELCALWELRKALRSGDLWLSASRRYANPEIYLLPQEQWPSYRTEICQQLQAPEDGSLRISQRKIELKEIAQEVEHLLANEELRLEEGAIVVSPLKAKEKPDSAVRLEEMIASRLPQVELSQLVMEVDRWTGFQQHFHHASGQKTRLSDFSTHLYASLLAQSSNMGFARMAQSSDLTYEQLSWFANWYIREETLKAANDTLVNFQHEQPFSKHWGGGTLSSSDGQRFPVSGKIKEASALPRYFGYGRGVTFYTWTSDQFSQFGTKVVSATVRDATYVLDALLDNETELDIVEHTTDTAGYTDLIFGLFDLLGIQFSPRIRGVGQLKLYQIDQLPKLPMLGSLFRGKLQERRVLEHWDSLLRVAGSLKLGWVTASLLISKLQSTPRQSSLTRALQEYGRLCKTLFVLRYLKSEEYRRRINRQLNKGEAMHALRQFLFLANRGRIRRKQEEEQHNQAACLTLITNAVVVWNTVYMSAIVKQLWEEGHMLQEEDFQYLSPARFEHINPFGSYRFELDESLERDQLRPLRPPK